MRKLLLILLIPILFACKNNSSFKIVGEIQGCDNAKVTLNIYESNDMKVISSGTLKNGKFELKGSVDYPRIVSLEIDANEVGAESEEYDNLKIYWSVFYIENSKISFTGDAATFPTKYYNPERVTVAPVIKGSATEELNREYKEYMKGVKAKYYELDERYSNEYFTPYINGEKDNIELGKSLAKEMTKEKEIIRKAEMEFIKEHPNSIISVDVFASLFSMYVNNTAAEIDELYSVIKPYWEDKPNYKEIEKIINNAKAIAIGEKFIDIELEDLSGNMVKLSSVIPQNKIVMLEFWASWCGPCRGEIPRIKKMYEKYKKQGFEVVSVSIDDKREEWLTAVKEEKMSWHQLRDPRGMTMESDVTKLYSVYGVPTCLMLDEQGRFYKTDMHGAFLEAFLEEYYGRK